VGEGGVGGAKEKVEVLIFLTIMGMLGTREELECIKMTYKGEKKNRKEKNC